MFGTYRLLLSILVALSHFGVGFGGFNQGQWSVVGFYFLSGFLMEKQFLKLSRESGITSFYLDRFIRIFPIFWVSILAIQCLAPQGVVSFLLNACLLPLNYFSLGWVSPMNNPTWSLACEFHYYLLVPLMARLPSSVLKGLFVLSLVSSLVAVWLPDTGFWAYYSLTGVLFIFLSGILLARSENSFLRGVAPFVAVVLVAFVALKYFQPEQRCGITINLCIGYLLALSAIPPLARKPTNLRWDKILGDLSYPLFLFHEVVQMAFLHWNLGHKPWLMLLTSLAISLLVVHGLEKPLNTLRYRLRTVLWIKRNPDLAS